MPTVLCQTTIPTATGRFSHLMALYAENHLRFERLFQLPPQPGCERLRSSLDDGLDIHLDILQRYRYTTELRLSYALPDPVTGEPDPSAYLRLYHDARLLEASHCYVGRRWQDVLGLHPAPGILINHRLRMNTFLGKWLNYLAEQGHSPFTLTASVQDDSTSRSQPPARGNSEYRTSS